jgi:hypothetical protein
MDPAQDEAPPSYSDSVSNPSAAPPLEKEIPLPQFESEGAEDGPSSPTLDVPPPFTLTPITLAILPNSMLIEPCKHNMRALYELTRPLSGHARTVGISEILPISRLGDNGMFKELKDKEKGMLWRVYENLSFPRTKDATAVSGQRRGREELGIGRGVVLRKKMGLGGKAWEAKGGGDEKKESSLRYSAKQKKGVVEWRDAKGAVVAVEMPAMHRETEPEKLEILVEMGKKDMDLLVGCWVGRIHQEMQKEGEKEDKREAKERKEEQWARDAAEGKPYGRLHECEYSLLGISNNIGQFLMICVVKETLGIGCHVKPRYAGLTTGPPTLTPEGRIKWS